MASENTDIELELMDLLRQNVRNSIGNAFIRDAFKVEKLSDTTLLVKPGNGWFDGLPIEMRFGKDHLVSGTILTAGTVPVGVTITDDSSGNGKVINLNSGGTTPTDTYKIVLSIKEEIITNVQDPFIKNANLTEDTSQKIRLNIRINVVSESDQTETPTPYTNDTTDENLVNQITVTPTAAGNGELISLSAISGSEEVDGRDVEIVLRNDPGVGSGNPIPNGSTDQQVFFNGKLIDSVGSEYWINAVFNDTVSTNVVIRIDKEVSQVNPQITNGLPFTLIKRNVFATDDINGNPQGRVFIPLATVDWDSTDGVVHESKVTDLRNSVSTLLDYEQTANAKFGLFLADGGDIHWDATESELTWDSNFKILNPGGPTQTIADDTTVMVDSGALAYEMNLASGGTLERGTLAVNVTSAGTTSSIDPEDLSTVRIGNTIKDSAGTVTHIVAVDDVNNEITTDVDLTGTGGATIYLDSYASGFVPINENTFILAVRDGSKVYVGINDLELEDGETSQIGDGVSSQLLALLGSTVSETTAPPYAYSSSIVIDDTDGFMEAIGKLDAALASITAYTHEDRNLKMIGGGTFYWDSISETLSWSANAYVQRPGFVDDRNQISTGNVVIGANEVAYVEINRTTDSPTVLTVSTATIDALTLNSNTLIIARRDGSDVIVGTHSFRLRSGERLELDGALQEINRLLGQLKITAHESDTDKVRISGADSSLLDGTTLSQELNDLILSFDGAVIDFTTGEVFESDGITPLGVDFTPFSVPTSEYFWYGIAIIPDSISLDNLQGAQVQVTLASASDSVQGDAPKPAISGDKKLGAVQVFNNTGTIEISSIRRLGVGSGSGGANKYKESDISDNQVAPDDVEGFLIDSEDSRAFSAEYSIRRRHLSGGLEIDTFYSNLGTGGISSEVHSLAIQTDGKILIGGNFTQIGGVTRNRFARLNEDGTVDATFYTNLGTAFGDRVWSIALQTDGKIVIVGEFTTFNGNTRNGIVRLNSDGTEDTTFYTNAGAAFGGQQARVVAIQSDGKILVGGLTFAGFDGGSSRNFCRINSDGSSDTTFNTNLGSGTDGSGTVATIAIQPDGNILIGGQFVTFDSTTRNRLMRINSDGTPDTTFYTNLGTAIGGVSTGVQSIIIQPDDKIIVGGAFVLFNSNTRNRMFRLNSDGTEDTAFYTALGTGFDGSVLSVVLQDTGKIIIGGSVFTTLNGVAQPNIVRLNADLTVDDSFTTNVGTGFPSAALYDIRLSNDGSILIGGNYTSFNSTTRNNLVELYENVDLKKQGTLRGIYDEEFLEWILGDGTNIGDDVEVDLTMTNSGQLQYTSSDLPGTPSESVIRFIINRL